MSAGQSVQNDACVIGSSLSLYARLKSTVYLELDMNQFARIFCLFRTGHGPMETGRIRKKRTVFKIQVVHKVLDGL